MTYNENTSHNLMNILNQNKKIRYIELFGGIGAGTQSLKKLYGIKNIELVDYIEKDIKPVESFNLINNTNFLPKDIKDSKLKIYKDVDLIIAGFPCQPYSVSGNLKGAQDERGKPLVDAMLEYIIKTNPKYILLENVRNFMSKQFVELREYILNKLKKWDLECRILNAKEYGIPQNRERVFITNIKFKDKHIATPKLKEYLDSIQCLIPNKTKYYTISEKNKIILEFNDKYIKVQNNTKKGFLEAIEGDCIDMNLPNCFTRRARTQPQRTNTLTTNAYLNIVERDEKNKLYYRKLTEMEYWYLMGFSLNDFFKVKKIHSKNILYKQAGNSIVVNVLDNILKDLR